MASGVRLRRLGRLSGATVMALALGGCMGMGGAGEDSQPTAEAAAAEEIDIRRYLGPDYCPEIRIREGTELLRRFAEGDAQEAEEDPAGEGGEPAQVIWQASIGDTARECLYDPQGNLTLRVGVSGRVVTGPKGSPGLTVSLPLRIAVVKYQEATLTSQLFPLSITMPPENSAVFKEVREIVVPSPGTDRDYIIYVGLDEEGKRLLGEKEEPKAKPTAPEVRRSQRRATRPAAAPRQQPAPAQQQASPPRQSPTPNVLPLPSEGFVLPGN